MHRVLATLVATALLIGCGEHEQQSSSSRAAYLASGQAHAAAYAALSFSEVTDDDGYTLCGFRSKRRYARDAARYAALLARDAADAVGTDGFYPAVRKADDAARDAWEAAQDFANCKPLRDPKAPQLLATALEAALKAVDAANRAIESHD